MKSFSTLFLAAAIAAGLALPMARPAQADTASTIAIAGAAAVIVGAILLDSNNQPYYVNNGRHVYVSRETATYYRAHGNYYRHGGQQHSGQQYGGRQYGGQQYNNH
jgi:hypothetical protein